MRKMKLLLSLALGVSLAGQVAVALPLQAGENSPSLMQNEGQGTNRDSSQEKARSVDETLYLIDKFVESTHKLGPEGEKVSRGGIDMLVKNAKECASYGEEGRCKTLHEEDQAEKANLPSPAHKEAQDHLDGILKQSFSEQRGKIKSTLFSLSEKVVDRVKVSIAVMHGEFETKVTSRLRSDKEVKEPLPGESLERARSKLIHPESKEKFKLLIEQGDSIANKQVDLSSPQKKVLADAVLRISAVREKNQLHNMEQERRNVIT